MILQFHPRSRHIHPFFALLILISTGLMMNGSRITLQAQGELPVSAVEIGAEIYNLDWNPVNQLLAVATATGTYIYTADLVEVAHFQTETWRVAWKPDGTQLAAIEVDTAADESRVIISDYEAKSRTFSQNSVITSPSFISDHFALAIAWHPDSSALAVMWVNRTDTATGYGYYGVLSIYDLNTRLTITPFSTETDVFPGEFMSWRAGSNQIAMPFNICPKAMREYMRESWDCGISYFRVGDIVSGEMLWSRSDMYTMDSLAWSPNGTKLLSVGGDIAIYDAASQKFLSLQSAIDAQVYIFMAVWGSDSKHFLGVGSDSTRSNRIYIYDVDQLTQLVKFDTFEPLTEKLTSIAWDDVNQYLFIGTEDGTLAKWTTDFEELDTDCASDCQ